MFTMHLIEALHKKIIFLQHLFILGTTDLGIHLSESSAMLFYLIICVQFLVVLSIFLVIPVSIIKVINNHLEKIL